MTARLAAIDCGTNSTRLLVAEPDGTTIERLMRITRLGQGVDRSGLLAPEAVERTVEVLREYAAREPAGKKRMPAADFLLLKIPVGIDASIVMP